MRLIVTLAVIFLAATKATAQLATPLLPPRALHEDRVELSDTKTDLVGKGKKWFPIGSQEDAKAFWGRDESKILSSGALVVEDKVFGANLELLSDIVGFFRVGLQVMAAGSDTDDEDNSNADEADGSAEKETVSRLANAGGVVRMTAALPVFYRSAPAFNSTWALMFSAAGGTETPKTGGFLEDPAATGQTGLELFYQRAGMDKRIDFEFGVTTRAYWFNNAYAAKAGTTENLAALLAPRIGIVLLENTKIDLTWRAVKSSAFDKLGTIAVTLQQISR